MVCKGQSRESIRNVAPRPAGINNVLYLKINAPIGLSADKKAQIKEMKDIRDERKAKKKAAKKEAKQANKNG